MTQTMWIVTKLPSVVLSNSTSWDISFVAFASTTFSLCVALSARFRKESRLTSLLALRLRPPSAVVTDTLSTNSGVSDARFALSKKTTSGVDCVSCRLMLSHHR